MAKDEGQSSPKTPKPPRRLSASLEDYLEAIYWLIEKHGVARVSQIAKRLGVSKSSVTGAIKHLTEKGYLVHDPYQFIKFTDTGMALAKDVVRRHQILKRFFLEVLNIDDALATETACNIEHHVNPQVVERLLKFVQFFNSYAPRGENWAELFAEFRRREPDAELCEKCKELEALRQDHPTNDGA